MFGLFKSKHINTNLWLMFSNHKTLRIRNHPININDEIILYSTDSNVGEDGMVEYHVKDDTFTVIKYPEDINPEYHSYCKYKNNVYIVNTDGTIIIYDIKHKKFKHITEIKNQQKIGRYSSCFNIGDDLIHIIGGTYNKHHLIYSIKHNKYYVKAHFGVEIENACIVKYINENKVYMFTGYCSEKIFEGTIKISHHHKEIKWQVSPNLKIPNRLRDCGYFLCAHYIVLLGGNGGFNKEYSDCIYLINLKENGKIEKLKNVHCPSKDKYHAVFVDHKVHIFGLWNDMNQYAISINNILPELVVETFEIEPTDVPQDEHIHTVENQDYKEEEIVYENNNQSVKPKMKVDDRKALEEKYNHSDEYGQENYIKQKQYIDDLENLLKMKDLRIDRLEKENGGLIDEQKLQFLEYQHKLKIFERKIKELELVNGKVKFDLVNWREWNTDIVVEWILSIENGLFNEYKELEEKLRKHYIEGKDFEDMNGHKYWKLCGIGKLVHREILIENINGLIGQQNNRKKINSDKKSNNANIEGDYDNTAQISN
eukprot:475272_1